VGEDLVLQQVGTGKLIPATRKALENAVGLLLKTDASESGNLNRNVLSIARSIGMLSNTDNEDSNFICEPLSVWIAAARRIQSFFSARDLHTQGVFSGFAPEEAEADAGLLKIRISYHSDHPSIRLRPDSTLSALFYCAAEMIARGITAHACDKCGTRFLGGGERSRNKKRADSRFCSDACRYDYHNERRRKTARKAKL
jgi:hypothetical protein